MSILPNTLHELIEADKLMNNAALSLRLSLKGV